MATSFDTTITTFSAVIDGKLVVNTTPHPLTYQGMDGEVVVIPTSVPQGEYTSPWVINARVVEEEVGADLVRTRFLGTPEGEAVLDVIEAWAAEKGVADDLRIIGSIIAAQAYPGRVLGMCPAPGFERVPPVQKRMTAQKFTTFA